MNPILNKEPVIFLKLGGSLITNKNIPYTPQRKRLNRIAQEIREAWQINKGMKLIIGHGSGSYGHVAARQYQTRQGIFKPEDWQGFTEVWYQARRLNQIVIESLYQNGLPIVAFPPSSSVIASNGKVKSWDLSPISKALDHGLIPIIQGDVIFDDCIGGTILSTEELFLFLTSKISANRVLLAGIEDGVWADFPSNTRLVPNITPENLPTLGGNLKTSSAVDVTGGMREKVQDMLEMVKADSAKEALIFSGVKRDNVLKALMGENPGTLITQSISIRRRS